MERIAGAKTAARAFNELAPGPPVGKGGVLLFVSQEGVLPTRLISALILVQWSKVPPG